MPLHTNCTQLFSEIQYGVDRILTIECVLGGESPLVIINKFLIESEKSEQRGFANFLKGLFGMFRNPLAHESKIKWEMNEDDALYILTLISYCHRRLDTTQRIR
jgi:uncharacterized protein (TIGR02391 family)